MAKANTGAATITNEQTDADRVPAFTEDDLNLLWEKSFERNKNRLGLSEKDAKAWADEARSAFEEVNRELEQGDLYKRL